MDKKHLIQSTIDALTSHIVILAGDGRIVGTNMAWKSYGLARQFDPKTCCVGSNYLAACDAADGEDRAAAEAVAGAIRSVSRGGGEQFVVPYTARTPDGVEQWVARISSFCDTDPVRVVVAHEEITALVESRSEEAPSRAIEALPTPTAYVEGDRIVLNEALQELAGFDDRSEFSLVEWLERLHGKTYAQFQQLLDLHHAEEIGSPFELPIRTREDEQRWVQLRVSPFTRGELWVFHDVTELKNREIAFGQTEEWTHRLMDVLPCPVLVFAPNGKVHRQSRSAVELLAGLVPTAGPLCEETLFHDAVREDGAIPVGGSPVAACLQGEAFEASSRIGLRAPGGLQAWLRCMVTELPWPSGERGAVLTLAPETADVEGAHSRPALLTAPESSPCRSR